MNNCPIGLDAIHCPNCSWSCDHPYKQASTPERALNERLLTIDEEHEKRLEWLKLDPATKISWRDYWLGAQRDLTASIYQQKIKELFDELEKKVIFVTHYAIFTSDNTNRLNDYESLKKKVLGCKQ